MLAEDLLLLLTEDSSGKFLLQSARMDNALASAVLLELTAKGRTRIQQDHKPDAGNVAVLDTTPLGDPILDSALQRISGQRSIALEDAISAIDTGLREQVLDRAVANGRLRASKRKMLGFISRDSWPAGDTTHKQSLLHRLHRVLINGQTPEADDVALVGLVYVFDQAHKLVSGAGMSRRDIQRRADDITTGDLAGTDVRETLNAIALVATTGGPDSPMIHSQS